MTRIYQVTSHNILIKTFLDYRDYNETSKQYDTRRTIHSQQIDTIKQNNKKRRGRSDNRFKEFFYRYLGDSSRYFFASNKRNQERWIFRFFQRTILSFCVIIYSSSCCDVRFNYDRYRRFKEHSAIRRTHYGHEKQAYSVIR